MLSLRRLIIPVSLGGLLLVYSIIFKYTFTANRIQQQQGLPALRRFSTLFVSSGEILVIETMTSPVYDRLLLGRGYDCFIRKREPFPISLSSSRLVSLF
jgi:hypothetical protein